MTLPNGNIFRITGPLWEEFTGRRWIPLTKASDAELGRFLWSAPEQKGQQIIETQVIWDTIALIMTSLLWHKIQNLLNIILEFWPMKSQLRLPTNNSRTIVF